MTERWLCFDAAGHFLDLQAINMCRKEYARGCVRSIAFNYSFIPPLDDQFRCEIWELDLYIMDGISPTKVLSTATVSLATS